MDKQSEYSKARGRQQEERLVMSWPRAFSCCLFCECDMETREGCDIPASFQYRIKAAAHALSE